MYTITTCLEECQWVKRRCHREEESAVKHRITISTSPQLHQNVNHSTLDVPFNRRQSGFPQKIISVPTADYNCLNTWKTCPYKSGTTWWDRLLSFMRRPMTKYGKERVLFLHEGPNEIPVTRGTCKQNASETYFFLVLSVYCYQPITLHPHAHMLSHVTPWTAARQAPLSTDFSRQEYWSGLPFPSPLTTDF